MTWPRPPHTITRPPRLHTVQRVLTSSVHLLQRRRRGYRTRNPDPIRPISALNVPSTSPQRCTSCWSKIPAGPHIALSAVCGTVPPPARHEPLVQSRAREHWTESVGQSESLATCRPGGQCWTIGPSGVETGDEIGLIALDATRARWEGGTTRQGKGPAAARGFVGVPTRTW